MAVRSILRWPDPRLSMPCAAVVAVDEGICALATDLLDTMYAAPGRGLAAPQVGVLVRVFVMDATWRDGPRSPRVLINPAITARSDAVVTGPEGCLSIPGLTTTLVRARDVTVAWTDLEGAPCRADLTGFDAVCAQHEIDHLDGIVTLDRLDAAARALALADYA